MEKSIHIRIIWYNNYNKSVTLMIDAQALINYVYTVYNFNMYVKIKFLNFSLKRALNAYLLFQ